MKNTFLKSKYWVIYNVLLAIFGEIIVLIAFLVVQNSLVMDRGLYLAFVLAFIVVILGPCGVLMLAPKVFLSKITLSNNSIQWILFGKTFFEVNWEEILDVKIEYRLNWKCLVFLSSKNIPGQKRNELYFNVDKENISTALSYCQNEKIRKKINIFINNKDYVTRLMIWQKN